MESFLSGALGSVAKWVIGLLAFLLLLFVLNMLAVTGSKIRAGVELRKLLARAKKEAKLKGLPVNEKWLILSSKSCRLLFIPVLGWVAFYVGVFLFLPLKSAAMSLLLLAAPGFGYFGYGFVPSDDPSSYL